MQMPTEAPPQRRLVTGGDPLAPCPVPDKLQFTGTDYVPDKYLSDFGQLVFAKKFPQLDGAVSVNFLWKGKGGISGGMATFGKCSKNSGLALFYSNFTDYTIWVAADHLRSSHFNLWQLEALLFHELLHVDYEEPEEEGDQPHKATKAHDVELFYEEIEHYGLWRQNLEHLSEVFQPALPFATERVG